MFSGPWEIIIVLFIVLLLFGKRLPSAMYSIGKSVTSFKEGMSEEEKVESNAKEDNA